MIDTYGTDALRMTLVIGSTPGNDVKFDEENVKNNMFFINKLWNASRFVSTHLDPDVIKKYDFTQVSQMLLDSQDILLSNELWILSRLSSMTQLVTDGLENYNFSEV